MAKSSGGKGHKEYGRRVRRPGGGGKQRGIRRVWLERIKVSFTEPVIGVDANTFYVTDGSGNPVGFMIDQIDGTTWAVFPYVSADRAFLSGGGYVIHVAPSRNGSTIRDFAGNALPNGPAAGGEYTFGFKAQKSSST